jgi:hypothetical protein
MKYAVLFLLAITTLQVSAQLKRKTHSTEFTEDEFYAVQNIRHGQFIRFGRNYLYRHIMIFGSYKQDKRSDDWYYFYRDLYNSLMSRGSFVKDKKMGSWFEYYPLQQVDSLTRPSRSIKVISRTDLYIDPVTKTTQTLAYDTLGQKLMSAGIFFENEKIGRWNYYGINGKLLHLYDHSLKKLIINNAVDSIPSGIAFLGGGTRFISLMHGHFTLDESRTYGQKSTLAYKVSTYGDTVKCERIKFVGSSAFAEYCDKILLQLNEDWIMVQPKIESELYILIDYLFEFRKGRTFSVRFVKKEQVDANVLR